MIPAGNQRQLEILRFKRGAKPQLRRDRLAVEEPLEIRLLTGQPGQPEGRALTITMRTPGQDYELAAGLLYSEGLIQQKSDIVKMTYCAPKDAQQYNVLQVRLRPGLEIPWQQLERYGVTQASCGLCGKVQIEQLQQELYPDFGELSPQLGPELIYGLSERMRPEQKLFARTGGVHASALFSAQGELLALCEDIGRHNALDKLIGQQLLADHLPLLQNILLVSGRIGYELVQKALKASIPVMIGVGAPSSLALELAQAYQQTLIGFLKQDSFNVYSGRQRLSLPD